MLQETQSSVYSLNLSTNSNTGNQSETQTNNSIIVSSAEVTVTNTKESTSNATNILINENNSLNNATVSSQTNVNHRVTSEDNVSMMSMPFAIPLSGLTTLPIALCSMNGCANIGVNNAAQATAGLMAQSGIVLLNMPGNNTALAGIPQLMTCNQMMQPLQPTVAAHSESNQSLTSSSAAPAQLASFPLQSQVSSNVVAATQVLNSINPIPLQSPVMQQTTPAAYMLVPIHQIPNNQSVVPQQNLLVNANPNQPIVVQTDRNQNLPANQLPASQIVASNLQNLISVPQSSVSSSNTVNSTLPSSTLSSSTPPVLASVSSSRTDLPGCSTSTLSTSNPINDPHISSSVQAVGSDDSSAPAPPVQENIQPEERAAGPSLPTSLTSSEINIVQNENLLPNQVEGSTDILLSDASHSNISSTSTQADNTIPPVKVPEKRKKGPAPKLDGNELCLICTDKASGYHYGVLSCEGCKGFFRRCITKNVDYHCKGTGQCQMDMFMRRKCQSCRLKKCRAVGMKDENPFKQIQSGLVIPSNRGNYDVFSELHPGSRSKKMKRDSLDSNSLPFASSDPSLNYRPPPTLSAHQRNVVEMLQANENRFQWPSQDDVDKVTPWIDSGDSHRCRAARFAHFTELAILIVQLVVEFTKQLPGFLTVSREDQIVLLKACTIEVMLLRAAKQYNKNTQSINFLNGKYYNKSSFYRAGMQVEFVDPIFDFCRSMAKLGLDEAEYALLVAINTFSTDRPNLKDMNKIEEVQDSYVELLRVYLKIHHPSDPLMFPRTLMKLVELRTLNNYHSEQMFALKVQDKQLPPLLAEIWDM